MKIKARVLPADDKQIAPGALKMSSQNVPVTIGFDSNKVVGTAVVFADGTAELEINLPLEQTEVGNDSGVLGLGYVVEKERQEGGVRIIEKLRPVTVGISAELVNRIRSTKAGGK